MRFEDGLGHPRTRFAFLRRRLGGEVLVDGSRDGAVHVEVVRHHERRLGPRSAVDSALDHWREQFGPPVVRRLETRVHHRRARAGLARLGRVRDVGRDGVHVAVDGGGDGPGAVDDPNVRAAVEEDARHRATDLSGPQNHVRSRLEVDVESHYVHR